MKRSLILLGLVVAAASPSNAQSYIAFPEKSIVGSGKDTLLLIGGMSCRWNLWESFMQRHSERFTMIAVTMPGNAGARLPHLAIDTDKPVWTENILTQLKHITDSLRIKNMTIVGHSWGTLVAVSFAARNKSIVKKLVNVDGQLEDLRVPDADSVRRRWRQSVPKLMEPLNSPQGWFGFNYVGPPRKDSISRTDALQYIRLVAGFTATDKTALRQYWREQFFYHVTEIARTLTIPILDIKCLTGTGQDSLRQVRMNEISNTKFKSNVKSVFFYNTNHYPMIQRPEWTDRAIDDFIADRKLATEFGGRPVQK